MANHVIGTDAQLVDITDDAERNGLPGMPGPPGEYLLRNLAHAAHEPVPATSDVQRILGREALDYSSWVQEAVR